MQIPMLSPTFKRLSSLSVKWGSQEYHLQRVMRRRIKWDNTSITVILLYKLGIGSRTPTPHTKIRDIKLPHLALQSHPQEKLVFSTGAFHTCKPCIFHLHLGEKKSIWVKKNPLDPYSLNLCCSRVNCIIIMIVAVIKLKYCNKIGPMFKPYSHVF